MDQDVCGLCKTSINPGAVVCVGCQGSIVYGATREEMSSAAKRWGFPAAILAIVGWGVIFGVSPGALVAGVIVGIAASVAGSASCRKSHVAEVRTFRHIHQ
jgi:hypothetical protein